MKENKEYEITKSNREDWVGVTFQCHIINKGVNVAPKWFREFVEKRFDPAISEINERLAKNDARWAKQEEFNKYVSDFIKQQVEFNKHVLGVFERNNLK
ncbi:MAG: hypothetical protein LBG49_02790 [Mycoplasmataceae bacterium]|jgi:hypothetical protein|nr:hypothetical protein [Mycoplasmataceae bacterium]